MVDSIYGWNIISDEFVSSKLMDNLKLYMFRTEEHVLYLLTHPHGPNSEKKIQCIYPFHEISCNFGSSAFFILPLPPKQRKNFFQWIYPFHEISCFLNGFFHLMKVYFLSFHPLPNNAKKIQLIYPFHEISCSFGSNAFFILHLSSLPSTLPPPTTPSPISQTVQNII